MTAIAAPNAPDPVRSAFDPDFYLKANPDVAAAGVDPFEHFMTHGWREGRDPSARFSIASYLELNPDIGAAGVNPFWHYIVAGKAEGRALKHELGFRYDILKAAVPLEIRLAELRANFPDREPDPPEKLLSALKHVGASTRLHVTISHDDYARNIGGIQACVAREAELVRRAGMDHLHLYPTAPSLTVDFERGAPLLGLLVNGEPAGDYTAEMHATSLAPLAAGREKSFAVHSLIGHSVDRVIAILRALEFEAGYFWTHDSSSLCAHYALLRDDVAFCGAPPVESPACTVCDYGQRRRVQLAAHVRFFRSFDLTVLAPSEAMLELWLSRFPLKPKVAIAHPHARLAPREGAYRAPEANRPLRVAFLGMPVEHKGWPVFASLVERFDDDPRYEFHHLGKVPGGKDLVRFTPVEPTVGVDDPMIQAIESLEIDVAIIWSLCPETFCFTAYEAAAGGAAVLTNPDAGNVARMAGVEASGQVLSDEKALLAAFADGSVTAWSRAKRRPSPRTLVHSRLTADFLLGPIQ